MNKKELVFISLAIFMTIIAWLVIDIYQIKRSTAEEIEAKPINLTNSEVTKKIIESLKNKTP